MKTEQALKRETEKWLLKIEKETRGIEPLNEKGREFLKNIRAYIKDSGYFLEKGDLVRAFEAVIWAWSLCETAKELELLKARKPNSEK